MSSPLISFVIPARNDQYAGNANYRLKVMIDFLSANLHKLNRLHDAEILVVDWGSDVPLSGAIVLSENARKITRFLWMPNHLAKKISPQQSFPISIVLNAGIRRALGAFIGLSPSDILFPLSMLGKIFEIVSDVPKYKGLAGKTLFNFNRKQVPLELVNTNPKLSDLEKFIETNDSHLSVDFHAFSLTPADCQLMHRKLWEECRGFDERHIYWGWIDVDLVIRMRLKYSAVNRLGRDHLYVYHLNHYVPPHGSRRTNQPFFNSFTVNKETWGLADYQFEEIPSAASPRLLPASLPVQPENMVASKREYVLLVLKFALSKPTWRNIRAAKSFLKAIISSGPQDSIWYRLYYFGRKLRKANRNRQAMPANVEEKSDSQ